MGGCKAGEVQGGCRWVSGGCHLWVSGLRHLPNRLSQGIKADFLVRQGAQPGCPRASSPTQPNSPTKVGSIVHARFPLPPQAEHLWRLAPSILRTTSVTYRVLGHVAQQS